jgi:hypothetical protein
MFDPVIKLLNEVEEQLRQRGFLPSRVWTANFLVAFKSKPLMILNAAFAQNVYPRCLQLQRPPMQTMKAATMNRLALKSNMTFDYN